MHHKFHIHKLLSAKQKVNALLACMILGIGLSGIGALLLNEGVFADDRDGVMMNPVRPPVNVGRKALLVTGKITNVLSWNPVPGVQSYSIYNKETKIASGLTDPTYTIPLNWVEPTWGNYTITSIKNGAESIPSAPAYFLYPEEVINNSDGSKPPTLTNLSSSISWDNSKPLVRIDFRNAHADAFSLYRDGVKIASNVSMFYGMDADAAPGSTHSYVATATYIDKNLGEHESDKSAPISVTIPAARSNTINALTISQTEPNDDSVKITVQAVPGAKDYRAYATSTPNKVKYSGGNTTVEVNGLAWDKSTDIVVEAVNELGPFQRSDGAWGPGTILPNTTTPLISFNGQGDPATVPNVIARSTTRFTPKPLVLTGEQQFLDTFHTNQDLKGVPLNQIHPDIVAESMYSSVAQLSEMKNDKWIIRNENTNRDPGVNNDGFFMSQHFMHTTSSLVGIAAGHMFMIPNGAPNTHPIIAPGQVGEFFGEVDAEASDSNRWNGIVITPQNDPILIQPNSMDKNHTSIHLRFIGYGHNVSDISVGFIDGSDSEPVTVPNLVPENKRPKLGNSSQNIDLRNRIQLFVSRNRIQVYVDGQLNNDYNVNQATNKKTGKPMELAWLEGQPLTVGHYTAVYHTPLAQRIYLANYNTADGAMGLSGRYWLNYRPNADERHWDNMGHQVLNTFPNQSNKDQSSLRLKLNLQGRSSNHYAHNKVTVTVSDAAKVKIGEVTTSSSADGTINIPRAQIDPNNKLNDTSSFIITIKPKYFITASATASRIFSNPLSLSAKLGDFRDQNIATVADVVDIIGAFQGRDVQAVKDAKNGDPVTANDVVDVIRNYQQ